MSDIREDSAKFEQIKKELEKEGMDKVQTMWKTNSVNEKTITDVLKSGMKTFEEKTGHPMSYSDMRELYG
ncbi:MAG: hypothetical protein K0U38_02460 [Epsilonproteobacteria bacterium]|nr:hypothetical protein [Campylobacterota bacterium]